MSPTNLTRRSFMKASALAAGAAALGSGVATVNNLVESDQAYAADEVKLVHTSCRACISNCGIIAHVQNGRVIKLEGDPADPMSEGRVCPKGLSGIQALYHPNRNKYPMKRVGERGGNQWERISWEEAIDTIADALMDMKDKTGLEGLLCSTGGGGNPQFFSPPRFRNFWGAGNVFEPGCAQCYLPRNYTMPLINGVSDTSIADSGCAELYNPTVSIDTYVMWGTGPAQHAPSSAGRAVVELRAAGTKTVVIDPRYTPDAARADVWLPVRPGTDVAMMLGWTRYIIDKKLYNEEFCSKWTNLPFLVDPSDPAGALLRASKVFADVTAENEGYVYYDEKTGEVTKALALGPDNEASYNPALFGAYDVTLADGTAIKAKTAFEAYKEQSDEFTIDHVAEVCMVDASDLEEAIKLYAECESGGISLGVATDQYPQSTQAAIDAAALDCMMGYIDKPGSPANSLPRSAESTVFPTGFFGDSPYQFQTPENIQNRLGYVEHKGLGGWMHSHIPTILNAILTGEPYQPHIWIERSGNKMAMLGNAASWVDAFPKLDLIVHMYMYPTSFSTEAADLLLPTAEWLETAFIQGRLYAVLLRQPVTNLFECIDETFIWSMLAKALAERGHEGMQKSFDQDACGPAPAYWDSMEDYYEWVASNVNMTWDELVAKAPYNAVEPEEYWNAPYEQAYRGLSSDGSSYIGFAGCAARDIKDNPLKCGPYGDTMIYLGRHGAESFEMPAASAEYLPMPYFHDPDDRLEYGNDYPLVLTEGRIPYFHHGTLRNNPYIREIYPAPEVWISPEYAEEHGIATGDWVNVKSPRTDGLDVFSNLKTGQELTAEGQSLVKDGIYGVAHVTEGIAKGSAYMERFWNPEFLEEGQDPRKSWTLCNMNVLTKNTGYYNPEFGTYTLRGINVKVEKASRPEGVWHEPTDFAPWLPQPSENTGGGAA